MRWLVGVLLLFAPAVDAGMTAGEVRSPPGFLEPSGPGGPLSFDVVIDCSSVLARTVPAAGGGFALSASLEHPPALQVSGDTQVDVAQEDCASPTGTVTKTFDLNVTATRDGRCFQRIPIAIEVTIPESQLDPVEPLSFEAEATPGAFVLFEATAADKLVTNRGTLGNATIALENFSNCAILLDISANATGGEVEAPSQGTLGAVGEDSATVNTGIIFHAPSGKGEWAVTVRFVGTPAGTSEPVQPGGPVTVTILFRGTASGDQGAPLPAAPWTALAVLAAAFLAQTKRK